MPFDNLNDVHFDATERSAVVAALTALDAAFAGKLANLTAEERQKYGSVNERNKLFVNKVMDYHLSQPNLCSPDVDWTEFKEDFASRQLLENAILRLQSLIKGMDNAKILHDYDNYTAALRDYDYSKYKASTNSPDYEVKVNELKQFFG